MEVITDMRIYHICSLFLYPMMARHAFVMYTQVAIIELRLLEILEYISSSVDSPSQISCSKYST